MTSETYNSAVNTLLDAYNTGDLQHGGCSKCAIGNLLETNMWGGDFYTKIEDHQQYDVRSGDRMLFLYTLRDDIDYSELDQLYSSKGFTRAELMKIEYAFESAIAHDYATLAGIKKGQFLGLQAVLKVMAGMVEQPADPTPDLERLTTIFESFSCKEQPQVV